jgi:hypothetical protein
MTPEEIEKIYEGMIELNIIIQGGDELRKMIGGKAYEKFEDKIFKTVQKATPDCVMGFMIGSESWVNPKPLVNRVEFPKYQKIASSEPASADQPVQTLVQEAPA